MYPMQSGIMFLVISMIFSIMSFFSRNSEKKLVKFSFLELNSAQYSLDLLIDWKLISFISIVSFITANIMIYSKSYMMNDLNKKRFTLILSMFALSMIWTILTSKNIMSMLIGWDFLGLSSLLLIIHYQSIYVYSFGMITFILNRMGDIAFIMTGAYMFNLGSWSMLYMLENSKMITIMLVIAAFTKSAQLPFSSWLPKAMAAPTPVSALVHSSTLVTAGVILLIRLEPSILDPKLNNLALLVSVTTMLVGSLAAMMDYDLKKIIAFSTLSQISFMMVILFMNSIDLAFMHLMIHALFKSLMFMSAGTIIHHSLGEQDIRNINMMSIWLPLETTLMNLSMLALMGFPFYSGYFSKDLMIEFSMNSKLNLIVMMSFDLSICLTALYSARLSIYLCWNKTNKNIMFNYITSNQEKLIMMILTLPIIMSGSLFTWIYIKNINIELPLPLIMKSFGTWGGIITLIMTFIMINYNSLVMNMKIKWFIYWMLFINLMFPLMAKKTLYLSINFMKYYENSWNKFISIIMMNNFKYLMMSNYMFTPMSILKIMLLFTSMMMFYYYKIN